MSLIRNQITVVNGKVKKIYKINIMAWICDYMKMNKQIHRYVIKMKQNK